MAELPGLVANHLKGIRTLIIAQLTDLHLRTGGELTFGKVDTAAFISAAVAAIGRLDPAPGVLLLTGDLVDNGAVEAYSLLAEILAPLDIPVRMLPGNHDARDAMREVFASTDYLPASGFLQYESDIGPLRLLCLDTLVEGKTYGHLCAERLDWLQTRLAERPEDPTVIALHHPPCPLGIAMDSIGLVEGSEALEKIVAMHANIERVICGHVHRTIHRRWAGTMVTAAPGPAHQIALSLESSQAFRIIMEPPSFHLHVWRPDTGLVTHACLVEDFPVAHEVRV